MRNYKPKLENANQLMIAFPKPETIENSSAPDKMTDLIAEEAIELIGVEQKLYAAAGAIYQFSDISRAKNQKFETHLLTGFWLKLCDLAKEVSLISECLVEYMAKPDQSDLIRESFNSRLKEIEEAEII